MKEHTEARSAPERSEGSNPESSSPEIPDTPLEGLAPARECWVMWNIETNEPCGPAKLPMDWIDCRPPPLIRPYVWVRMAPVSPSLEAPKALEKAKAAVDAWNLWDNAGGETAPSVAWLDAMADLESALLAPPPSPVQGGATLEPVRAGDKAVKVPDPIFDKLDNLVDLFDAARDVESGETEYYYCRDPQAASTLLREISKAFEAPAQAVQGAPTEAGPT